MKLFHRHQWEDLSTQNLYEEHYASGGWVKIGPDTPITEVLQRCTDAGCGELRTTTLDGHWTIEQIKGGQK